MAAHCGSGGVGFKSGVGLIRWLGGIQHGVLVGQFVICGGCEQTLRHVATLCNGVTWG